MRNIRHEELYFTDDKIDFYLTRTDLQTPYGKQVLLATRGTNKIVIYVGDPTKGEVPQEIVAENKDEARHILHKMEAGIPRKNVYIYPNL